MIRSVTIGVLLVVVLLITGCQHKPTLIDEQTSEFEQKHAEEMAKKANLPGTGTATTELLYPDNPHPIRTHRVEYTSGVTGFYAEPTDLDVAPGVVVIHERWGLNQHIEDMTRVLAANGYKALAVDLYNGQVATDASRARELSSSVDQQAATSNLLAAEDYLRSTATASRVASLGRCFGGHQSLELSVASDSLDGTIIYYGQLTDDASILRNIQAPVRGVFAAEDGSIPPEDVAAFAERLEELGKTQEIIVYSGVGHAFANPTGDNHDPARTVDAWSGTVEFLKNMVGAE